MKDKLIIHQTGRRTHILSSLARKDPPIIYTLEKRKTWTCSHVRLQRKEVLHGVEIARRLPTRTRDE
jgi:hypothetical protein